MIVFVTLFLGLVFGPQSISVIVGDEVDRVEIVVDGLRVAELADAPWSLEWDFGEDLAPRELEAVAFDAEGEEIGRARQWLNLPRQPAEAAILVRGGKNG
ncbi:MAG: hypothetical protein GY769_25875, partial [bacterium]|nr:hypothetical protein [bacterium]